MSTQSYAVLLFDDSPGMPHTVLERQMFLASSNPVTSRLNGCGIAEPQSYSSQKRVSQRLETVDNDLKDNSYLRLRNAAVVAVSETKGADALAVLHDAAVVAVEVARIGFRAVRFAVKRKLAMPGVVSVDLMTISQFTLFMSTIG